MTPPPSVHRPPLEDLAALAHKWIRGHPGHNTESIAQEMTHENPLLDYKELVNAIEFLVWNDYAARDEHLRIFYRE